MNDTGQQVDLVDGEIVVGIAGAALMAALTGVLAYLALPYPWSPEPITLQILGIFLVGVFLGAKWGGLSMVLYLVAGGVGAPVFAHGQAGIGHLFGSSAGYLFSFPIAVVVIGLLAYGHTGMGDPSSLSHSRLIGSLVAGAAIIYALGIVGLMVVLELSLVEALIGGAVVFFPGEAAKIAAAVAIAQSGHVVDWPPQGIGQ
ncbi:biotin transporter BioY [Natranaeroarchaeum aerophilus]|uniref:Biotin transporter BioY n=1 Tax=Natranaeroarchaeum aerophilus TaxID=2917711 RepID=A0AAE3FLU2_9EURY|nr:biotin transporter BioY [Natranaeroarchaeum aerophilus]MCL9812242.1 biotin transporter BioY [Natranaeroarchaeum aerophilus]